VEQDKRRLCQGWENIGQRIADQRPPVPRCPRRENVRRHQVPSSVSRRMWLERSKDACVKGGKTSASELAINAESCPTTGDEPTAAPDMCTGIVCGRLCKGECGWSKGANGCIRGGKTTVSEARINAELCPEAGVTETEGAVDSAKLEQDFLKQECNRVKCADFCVGPCGWSTGSMSCKLGANTALSELGLGQC